MGLDLQLLEDLTNLLTILIFSFEKAVINNSLITVGGSIGLWPSIERQANIN